MQIPGLVEVVVVEGSKSDCGSKNRTGACEPFLHQPRYGYQAARTVKEFEHTSLQRAMQLSSNQILTPSPYSNILNPARSSSLGKE
jgi:hypothetical protein